MFGELVFVVFDFFCNVILLHFFGAETVILLENPEGLDDYFFSLSSFLFSQFWFFPLKGWPFILKSQIFMHFIYTDTDINHLELCIPQFIDFNASLSNWHAFKLGFNSAVYSVDETVDWL